MEKLSHYVELSYGKAIPLRGTVLWKSYPITWNCLMEKLSHYVELSYAKAIPLDGTVLW